MLNGIYVLTLPIILPVHFQRFDFDTQKKESFKLNHEYVYREKKQLQLVINISTDNVNFVKLKYLGLKNYWKRKMWLQLIFFVLHRMSFPFEFDIVPIIETYNKEFDHPEYNTSM